MNGNNIIILKDGTAIASCKSHEITTSAGTIEVASSSQQAWKKFIADRKEWSVNVSYLVTAASQLSDLLQVGNSYTLVIRDRSNTVSRTGTAILTQCKQTYTRGSLIAGSFQFRGTSALT